MPRKSKLVELQKLQVDLEQILNEFLLVKQANGFAPRTLKDYRWHIKSFLKFANNPTSYDALQKAVLFYLSQPCSPGYRNIKLKNLRSFFNWCVQEGYLPVNPTLGIKKSKEDDENVRHVKLEDIKKLLQEIDKKSYTGLRDYTLVLVQIDTGGRPGELLQIVPSDISLDSREIRIRPEVSKTRIARTLVLSPYTTQVLAKLLRLRPSWWGENVPVFASENGKILSTSWWSKRIARYSRLAGVKITPYSLRHTFAIEFLRNGGDLFSLQRILGHLDLTTTKRYIHLSQDDIREIHSKASPVQKLQEIDRRAPRSIKET